MIRDDVFPSPYLKCPDLNGKPTQATIESAPLETLKSPEGKTQDRSALCRIEEVAAAERDEL